MKVLFVTEYRPAIFESALRMLSMVRYLPCDLMEGYSVEDIRRCSPMVDVILLEGVSYWRELTFLKQYKNTLTGFIYSGEFKPAAKGEEIRRAVGVDFHLSLFPNYVIRERPQWVPGMFSCPPCIDIQDYRPPQDIDVLVFGEPPTKKHTFKGFTVGVLRNHIVKQVEQTNPFLCLYDINIGGEGYRYAYVSGHASPSTPSKLTVRHNNYGYHGSRLYRLISRARVCVTEAKYQRVCRHLHFTSPACGTMIISDDFIDREPLGFKHGENIWITDENHFASDLQYLMEDSDITRRISESAREFIRTRHTRKVRAQQLYEFLCKRTGGS